jgi:hypothetical protein
VSFVWFVGLQVSLNRSKDFSGRDRSQKPNHDAEGEHENGSDGKAGRSHKLAAGEPKILDHNFQ